MDRRSIFWLQRIAGSAWDIDTMGLPCLVRLMGFLRLRFIRSPDAEKPSRPARSVAYRVVVNPLVCLGGAMTRGNGRRFRTVNSIKSIVITVNRPGAYWHAQEVDELPVTGIDVFERQIVTNSR